MAGQQIMVMTQADRDLIQRFLDEKRRSPLNAIQRGREGAMEHEEWLTPEVYVARIPVLGIPALVGSADEDIIGNDGDIPGYADCYIYRIVVASGQPKLRKISFAKKRVYNLFGAQIEDVPWIPVLRDKFGSWLAIGGTFSGDDVGTGTDAEDFCGHLVLNCPEEEPGTGSEVSGGYTSSCNDGETIPDTVHLTITYGSDSVSVALATTDGNTWSYPGPTVDVGSCGAGFQIAGVTLRCDPPWNLQIAALINGVLTSFGNPGDYPNLTVLSSSAPLHHQTVSYGEVFTGCGFEFIELDLTP